MKKKRSPGPRLISDPGPHSAVVKHRNIPPRDLYI